MRKESVENGIYIGMGGNPKTPRRAALEAVRCLECGEMYSKPQTGGTTEENPGCPGCGYLGWISAVIPVTSWKSEHPHYDGGQLRHHAARLH